MLQRLPELRQIAEIIRFQTRRWDGSDQPGAGPTGEHLPWGARAMKLAWDYLSLIARKLDPETAVDQMRRQSGWYDQSILELLASTVGTRIIQEIDPTPVSSLIAGHVLAEDLCARNGGIVIPRRRPISNAEIQRLQRYIRSVGIEDLAMVIRRKPRT